MTIINMTIFADIYNKLKLIKITVIFYRNIFDGEPARHAVVNII